MILSFKEITKPDIIDRVFYIECDGNEGAADVARLCGKLPKANEPRGGEGPHKDWICYEIKFTPMRGGGWGVSAFYRAPIIVAEESDEPRFPPYSGPKGKQPDGSFILTPRCWSKLAHAMRWRCGLKFGMDMRVHTFLRCWDEFDKALSEDTGLEMETYT